MLLTPSLPPLKIFSLMSLQFHLPACLRIILPSIKKLDHSVGEQVVGQTLRLQYFTMKTALACLLLLCHSVIAGTPTEALKAFQQAAKDQKLEEAQKHTAQFEGASEDVSQYLKARLQRILKLFADGWGLEILEEKISGDCAVIITKESAKVGKKAFDMDPVYMIKQGEEWRVMPEITKWDMTKRIPPEEQPASMKLDERKLAAYKELEKWFDERKEALKKERQP